VEIPLKTKAKEEDYKKSKGKAAHNQSN